jgi:hypothetical protein
MAESKKEATAVLEPRIAGLEPKKETASPVVAPSLAELEAQLKAAQKALADARKVGAKRGIHAVTGAPTRDDLPEVTAGQKDSTGMVIDRWISQLLKAGKASEAGAIGNLYNKLVRHNLISVPECPELLQ